MCEQWSKNSLSYVAVLEVMGIDRMHRSGGKICFMYDELQSSPLELCLENLSHTLKIR